MRRAGCSNETTSTLMDEMEERRRGGMGRGTGSELLDEGGSRETCSGGGAVFRQQLLPSPPDTLPII